VKHEHRFRQSWLGTLEKCPEMARHEHAGTMPRIESDATAVGTAFHEAVEAALSSWQTQGAPLRELDAIEIGQLAFDGLLDQIRWQKYNENSARKYIATAVSAWYRETLPQLGGPVAMEHSFDEVFHEDDERVIRLTGTIDYLDSKVGLVDWKTGSRKYELWEKQRWAIQPTVYTWAWHGAGSNPLVGEQREALIEPTDRFTFTYFVHFRDGGVQRLEVMRTQADWSWLREKCIAVAQQIEAGLDSWPRNDAGWWCSARWCPIFAAGECKGAHLGAERWK